MSKRKENPQHAAGPKFKWTPRRLSAVAKKINRYCDEASSRVGEVRGLSFVGPTLPTISECLIKNKISSYVVRVYESQHEELGRAVKKIRDLQEHFLVKFGLSGGYNTTAFIFTAKNLLGWRDVNAPLVDQSNHTHYVNAVTQMVREVNSAALPTEEPPKPQDEHGSNGNGRLIA